MENKSVATTRRIGAGLTLAAGIIELLLFYLLPAFDAYFFEFSPYQVLRAGNLLDYQSSTCTLLIVLAVAGALVCAALSVFILIMPESPSHGVISTGAGSGYCIGLIPYFFLIISAATNSYASDMIKFSSILAYILCSSLAAAGLSFMAAKSAPAAVPASPAGGASDVTRPQNPILSDPVTPAAPIPAAEPKQLVLVRMNTQERFPITSAVVLGRSAADANIVVTGNGLIGRQHAKIDYHNGCFFVTDLNSKNKTYLNDVCLQPNSAYALKQGDYITLANEVFAVDSIHC